MKSIVFVCLFVSSVAFAVDWSPTGIYGSSVDPIDGGVVSVPASASALSTLQVWVKDGESLVFQGEPLNFAANATISLGSGTVVSDSKVVAAGDLNFASAKTGIVSYSGAYLMPTKDEATILFSNVTLSDYVPLSTVFDKNEVLVNTTVTGWARVVHRIESPDESSVIVQFQVLDGLDSKVVELTLFQSGNDVKGYVSGAWYCTGDCVGLDFRTIPERSSYDVRTPSWIARGGMGLDNVKMARRDTARFVLRNVLDGSGALKIASGAHLVADGPIALTQETSYANAIDVAEGGSLTVRDRSLALSGGISGTGTVRCRATEDVRAYAHPDRLPLTAGTKALVAPGMKWANLTNVTGRIRYRVNDQGEFDTKGAYLAYADARSACIEMYWFGTYYIYIVHLQAKVDNRLLCVVLCTDTTATGLHSWNFRWGYREDTAETTYDVGYYFDMSVNSPTLGLSSDLLNGGDPDKGVNVEGSVWTFATDTAEKTVTLSSTTAWTSPENVEETGGVLEMEGTDSVTMKVSVMQKKAIPVRGRILVRNGGKLIGGVYLEGGVSPYVYAGGIIRQESYYAFAEYRNRIHLRGGTYQIGTQDDPPYVYLTPGSCITGGTLVLGDYSGTYQIASTLSCETANAPRIDSNILLSSGDGTGKNIFFAPCGTSELIVNGAISEHATRNSFLLTKTRTGTLSLAGANTFAKTLSVEQGTVNLAASGTLGGQDVDFTNAGKTKAGLSSAADATNAIGNLSFGATNEFAFAEGAQLSVASVDSLSASSVLLSGALGAQTFRIGTSACLSASDLKAMRYVDDPKGKGKVAQDAGGWITPKGCGLVLIVR